MVVLAAPAAADVGLIDVMLGAGFLTGRANKLEMPPFGCGFTTAISSVPELAMSAAGMSASSVAESEKPVCTLMPFTVTTDLGTKFVPETVRANAGPPAETPVGEREVICGTWLDDASTKN